MLNSSASTQLSLKEAADQSGWPLELLEDASRQPCIADSIETFSRFVCYGDHSKAQCCVLPGGISNLGLDKSIPAALLDACRQDSNPVDCVLQAAEQGAGGNEDNLSGDVYWWFPEERNREEMSGTSMRNKLLRFKENASSDLMVYIAELKREHHSPHSITAELTDTLSSKDLKDCIQGCLPMWDRGHGFVGSAGAGICLHVDQVCWSNISKNFLGHKLVALWGPEEQSEVLATCGGELFRKPLSEAQLKALRSASLVALLRPGDIASFTGGLPHVTAVVGNSLNLTFYESFLNWNRCNAELLLCGASRPSGQHWWQNVMEETMMNGILDDIVDCVKDCETSDDLPELLGKKVASKSSRALVIREFQNALVASPHCAERFRQLGEAAEAASLSDDDVGPVPLKRQRRAKLDSS
eukprot:TRINITY_DN16050_c1_g1_i2.p1 TRINITY_DN16050_c1_g1~~TRINITY_DN16050_c1_g1_i2.p1  ORF type:complete len:413 (-),score=74.30 TRINITY_DN16050_c1_g1_i2:85-1323(-)